MKDSDMAGSGDAEPVSKSQRKRESTALQHLADELVDLTANQLATITLPKSVEAAVVEGRAIKSHGARKRHIKHIAVLLRDMDDRTLIDEGMKRLHSQSRQANQQFHRIEGWRDRLLQQGDEALSALAADYPALDRQQIRQLVRNAQHEAASDKPPRSARRLFHLLRDLLGDDA